MTEEVLNFIKAFTDFGTPVKECFTCGNCYWFAYILHSRFPGSSIVYDVVANHFACQICGKVFDITGDVTKQYHWDFWERLIHDYDPLVISRIQRDCINF